MLHTLEHVVIHAIEDNLRMIPFLFVTYCIMESMEHAVASKTEGAVKCSGKLGPFLGGILGILPQCGFSAAAASFYSGGVITLGTLLAIFLSTSDEMLPILISETVPAMTIVKILGMKAVIGILGGFLPVWASSRSWLEPVLPLLASTFLRITYQFPLAMF